MNHTINITCLVFVPINDTDFETVLESSRTFLLVSGQSRRMIEGLMNLAFRKERKKKKKKKKKKKRKKRKRKKRKKGDREGQENRSIVLLELSFVFVSITCPLTV